MHVTLSQIIETPVFRGQRSAVIITRKDCSGCEKLVVGATKLLTPCQATT